MAGLISSSVNTRARLLLLLLLLLVLCSVPGFQQPIVSYIRNVARTASTTRVCASDDDDAEGSPPFGKSELMERMMRSVQESQKVTAEKMKQLQDKIEQLQDDNKQYRDETKQYRDETKQLRDDNKQYRDETKQLRDDNKQYRDEAKQLRGMVQDVQKRQEKMATKEQVQDMEKRQEKMATKEQVQDIEKNFSDLDVTSGILVEDKARIVASRSFGDEWSKSLTIKSIHDIVELISKANTKNVPNDEYKAADDCKDAETKVVDFLRPLLFSAVKSAANAVLKQSQTDEFEDEVFAQAKRNIDKATQNIVKVESTTEDVGNYLKNNLGKIIGAVIQLSEDTPPDEDDSVAADKRKKLMEGRFKNKLVRIKRGLGNERNGLIDPRGPGVLLCCAISSVYGEYVREEEGKSTGEYDMAGLSNWLAEKGNIFDFKEQLECDFQGRLVLDNQNAYIERGEAKTSIKYKGEAMRSK
jgi:hypothetical protein